MFSRRSLLAIPAALVSPAFAQVHRDKLKITKFVTHKAKMDGRDYLFLQVHTDGGIIGLGEGSISGRIDIMDAAVRWLEPHFVGKDPAGMQDHWDRMYYRLSRWRDGSVHMTALAAVDIALWDIEGKRLGVPIWRLLGGPIHPKLRLYFSHWSNTAQSKTPQGFAERVPSTIEEGWTAVKWVVRRTGSERERIEQTVAETEAVRKAAGMKLDIGLELAESHSIRSTLELAHRVAPFRPMFIEEPTLRESPQGLGEVAAKSPVPIATGEGLLTRFDFRHLLEAKGAAIIQPDVIHCGGITEFVRIANYAEVYGVELAPHMWYGPIAHAASIQAASCCRNFLIQEWDGTSVKRFDELTRGTLPTQKGGFVSLPEKPGLGIEVDFEQLAKRFPYA